MQRVHLFRLPVDIELIAVIFVGQGKLEYHLKIFKSHDLGDFCAQRNNAQKCLVQNKMCQKISGLTKFHSNYILAPNIFWSKNCWSTSSARSATLGYTS